MTPKNAQKKEPTWPAIIKLVEPIEANGETIYELTMQRPKVKHLKIVDTVSGDVEMAIMLVSKLCNVPPSSVEELDAEDMAACSELLEGIMKKKRPATGRI